jgi:CspA family cold shock protein
MGDAGGFLSRAGNRAIGRSGFVMASYDNAGSRMGSAPQRATVKWFNSAKVFGFVTLEDGSDAFCHASALANLPSTELPQGATVFCEVANGQRGMQVTNVHSVDLSTAEAQPMTRGPRQSRGPREASGPMGDGHVKFFNEQKGFGFVVPETGGADIYVHASALRRSGVPTLMPEQKVRFSTRQGMKGVEVDRIELA